MCWVPGTELGNAHLDREKIALALREFTILSEINYSLSTKTIIALHER